MFTRRGDRDGGSSSSHDQPGRAPGKRTLTQSIQRKPAATPEAPADGPGPAPVAVATGGGSTMPPPVQQQMERSFATDFSDVRIHQGPQAEAMGAVAYTQGNDIHFQPGRYDPESRSGQELLGHELAHVVQQRAGQVRPQGKDSPINDDHALEAEADAMGARAARGEPAGVASSAPAATAPGGPIQLYKDVKIHDEKWRVSENHKVLAKTSGEPGDRSHSIWADGELVTSATQALATAGSFIKLESTGSEQTLVLRDNGRGVTTKDEILRETMSTFTMDGEWKPSKEWDKARERQLEVQKPNQVEDREVTLKGVKASFLPQQGKTYDVMTQQQTQSSEKEHRPRHNHNQQDLFTPSDCNETARVIMGVKESERNEQPMVNSGDGVKSVAPQEVGFGKTGGGGAIVENGGLTATDEAFKGYEKIIDNRNVLDKDKQKFKELRGGTMKGPGYALNLLRAIKEQATTVYEDFIAWAKLDTKVAPEIGDALVTYRLDKTPRDPTRNPKLYKGLLDALVTKLKVQENRAKEILTENGITEDTTYFTMAERIDDRLLPWLSKPQNGLQPTDLKEALSSVTEVNDKNILWNKHWGGVVMKDGGDFVTLENDSSSKDKKDNVKVPNSDTPVNQHWGFAMYGTAKPEQTFHEQMMKTGDFGDFASTMTYRRAPKVQQNDGLLPDEKTLLKHVLQGKVNPSDLQEAMGKNLIAVNKLIRSCKEKLKIQDLAQAAAKAQEDNLLA